MSWSRIQSASNFTGSAVTTLAATYGTSLTAGTKLIAIVQTNDTGNGFCTGVSDGNSNAFTKVADSGETGGYGGVQIWVLDTPVADVGTMQVITATRDANEKMSLLIQEVSGLATGTTGSVDGTPGTLNGNGGSGAVTTGTPTYSSAASNEYLITAVGLNNNGGSFPVLVSSSGSLTADPNNVSFAQAASECGAAYGNSTGGAETNGWAISPGGSSFLGWGVAFAAFKLASGVTRTAAAALTVTPSFAAAAARTAVTGAALTVTPALHATARNATAKNIPGHFFPFSQNATPGWFPFR